MFNDILLEDEIQSIVNRSTKQNFPDFDLTLNTTDADIPIKYLWNIDIVRDFESNISDIITAEIHIPMGDYQRYFYPNKDKLEITLCINRGDKTICHKYKGLMLNIDKTTTSSRMQGLSQEDLNKLNLIDIKLQLINPEIMMFKQLNHEGIYKNGTIPEISIQAMIYELSKIKLGGRFFNIAYNRYKDPSEVSYDQVVIPNGTKVATIPKFLHRNYGMYQGDVNVYYNMDSVLTKNLYIWQYPLYDAERVTKQKNIAMFYNTGKNGLGLSEISYLKEKTGELKFVTDKIEILDKGNNDLFNKGKGLSTTISNSIYNLSADDTKDSTNGSDGEVARLNTFAIQNEDGLDYSNYVGMTNNILRNTAALNKDRYTYIQFAISYFDGWWERHPYEQMIYPGMPCYFIYNKDNITNKLPGTILKQHISYQIQKKIVNTAFLIGVKKPLIEATEE